MALNSATGELTIDTSDLSKVGNSFVIVLQAFNYDSSTWAGFFFTLQLETNCSLASLSDPIVDPAAYTFDVWQSTSIPFTPAISSESCGTITYTLKRSADDT